MLRYAVVLLLSVIVHAAAAEDASVLGKWKTFDEKSGKPKGLVEITQTGDEFKGFLRERFQNLERTQCTACEGDKKNAPLKDLEIIWSVKSTGKGEWGGGQILDPENGKTYRVKFALIEEGRKLKVRGYLGISLLGRTQVWERQAAETTAPKVSAN